jgi:PAS domain S-box-containing protein
MKNSSAGPESRSPVNVYGDAERITRIFHWFIGFIFVGLVSGIIISYWANDIRPSILILISLVPILASLYFVRRKMFELAAVFLSVILIFLVTMTATAGLGIHHISILGYPAILIVASLVVRKRTMVFLTLFNIVCAAWLVFGELAGKFRPEPLVRSVPGDFFSVSIILILTAVMVRLISESLFQSNLNLTKGLKERTEAEEKYRDIVENAVDGIFQSTPDGRFVSVNPAMARMYGYDSPEDMISSITDISSQLYVEPDLRDDLRNRLLAGERITGFESQEYRKDGSKIWTSMSVRAIRDEMRAILYYEGTVEDITNRKMAEEVLRESENRYRTLFNGMLDGIYRSSHDGSFVDVNPAMIKMFGYDSKAEMLALDIKKDMYFAPEERESLFLDTNSEKVDIFRMRRRDGSEIWVEDHGRYVHDKKGKVIYHEGILRDITPRIRIESERERLIQELEIKNAESETLRESLASIVGTFEFTEIIQRILDQIQRVVPYDSASVWRLEGNLQKFIAGRNLPSKFENANVTYPLGDTNSASPALRGEIPYVLNNNVQEELPDFREPPDDMINSWLAIPLKTRGRIIGMIALDGYHKDQFNVHHAELGVTFANQVAIALENARLFTELQGELALRENLIKELEAKNSELERFTYTVSHDLKAPLVTINGFLGYLESDAVSGKIDQVKRDSQRIQEAVNKMYTLLNELLELSRIGRMKNASETIRFEDLVKTALEIVHGRLEERGVSVQIQPDLPDIYGDRQRLTEVLQNLIDNAAKFMGDQANPRIEIGCRPAENNLQVFFVKDNGVGILPEYHERVFGLFNKLDAQGEGTGVGLALVKRIIEVHGGKVWVESEKGKGSTFCFTVARGDEDWLIRTS